MKTGFIKRFADDIREFAYLDALFRMIYNEKQFHRLCSNSLRFLSDYLHDFDVKTGIENCTVLKRITTTNGKKSKMRNDFVSYIDFDYRFDKVYLFDKKKYLEFIPSIEMKKIKEDIFISSVHFRFSWHPEHFRYVIPKTLDDYRIDEVELGFRAHFEYRTLYSKVHRVYKYMSYNTFISNFKTFRFETIESIRKSIQNPLEQWNNNIENIFYTKDGFGSYANYV